MGRWEDMVTHGGSAREIMSLLSLAMRVSRSRTRTRRGPRDAGSALRGTSAVSALVDGVVKNRRLVIANMMC